MIKTEKEISRMSQAAQITDQVYQKILKAVRPGMSEKDLAKIIRNSFEESGATSDARVPAWQDLSN